MIANKQELEDLIKQAKEGKQIAFTKLYNMYKQVIYYTIIQIVKNKDVADDLTSITFSKAFLKLDSYVNHISFEMWLKTIAVNSSIDYIRHYKKDSQLNWLDDNETCKIQLDSTADYSPEETYLFKETSLLLEDCLSRLRFKYRQILLMRCIQNLSYKEISKELNLTEPQVKSLLNKARKKLKELLNQN